MNLFERIFSPSARKMAKEAKETFRLMTGYQPHWHSWGGKIYESELVRSAIDAGARHASKLALNVKGTAKPKLWSHTRSGANEFQTWSQFLYRVYTILMVKNNCYIVPVEADDGTHIGFTCVIPKETQLKQYKGRVYLRIKAEGGWAAVELAKCGILTRFQFDDDLFGSDNHAMKQIMELIEMQRQGTTEAIKNSATFRFMARISNFSDEEDLALERERFNNKQLRSGSGGILLFPNTYTDIKQLEQKAYTVDADQQKIIRTGVFEYFGVNEDVLQNKAYGDAWSAYYEGNIEPFAVSLSQTLTRMTYSDVEIANGNSIMFSANRLQYMSNSEKLNVSSAMVDRGIMTRNEAREIWNLPPVEGGDEFIVRAEYVSTDATEGGNQDANETE